jgi:hypothetical protein
MTTTTYTPVSLDKIDTLDSSTVGIIEFARALLTDKQHLPKAEFNKIVQSFGWGKDLVQRYIKIAIAFADVEITKLARIEPHTLFKITATKKFASVVESIRNSVGHVTQQLVENLIAALIAPRVAKSDKPTIWRAEKDGSRSCVVPPIKEDDQFTGMSIQEAMDSEGITAQAFVREAAAFREAWLCGAFLLVGELPPHLQTILGEKLESVASIPVDNIEVKTSDEQSETDETIVKVVEVVETMEIEVLEVVEPTKVPQIELATPQDSETSIEGNENLPLSDSIESMSLDYIAALLVQCTTWSEIVAMAAATPCGSIASRFDEQTRLHSWNLLAESEKRRITAMKEASQTIPSIKVGDKVNWANHYPVATSRSARN